MSREELPQWLFYHDNELLRTEPSLQETIDPSILGIPRTVFDTSVTSESLIEESHFLSFSLPAFAMSVNPNEFCLSPPDLEIPEPDHSKENVDVLMTPEVKLFWERYAEYPSYLRKQKKRIKRRNKRIEAAKSTKSAPTIVCK